ncbi:MAG TPA: hypothetical protein DCO78_08895 [Chitinophagaceae bacterium]|nr:hypothetical protein [Chitinophagaceae bacterium]
MNKRDHILQELQEIAPELAALNRAMPYALPEGYFDALSANVLMKIQLTESRSSTYSSPAGNFDTLPNMILAKIKAGQNEVAAELNEVAPLLNTISKAPVYAVPEGYFEQLSIPAPTAKVVKMGGTRRWMQLAVAAVTMGVLVTAAFLFTDQNPKSLDYQQYESIDAQAAVKNLSDETLIEYMEAQASLSGSDVVVESGNLESNDLQIISDEELSNFVNDNPVINKKNS